ncbi:MAG: primosomal protein N' [Myxococcota bacterium]
MNSNGTPCARVLVRAPLGPLDYRLPDELVADVHVGSTVRVPLGAREVFGYVLELIPAPSRAAGEVRDILAVDREAAVLPGELLQLVIFAADYYLVPPGELLSVVLPPETRSVAVQYVACLDPPMHTPSRRAKHDDVMAVAARHPQGLGAAALERELGWPRARAQRALRDLERQGLLRPTRQKGRVRCAAAFRRLDGDVTQIGARRQATLALWQALPTQGHVLAADIARDHPGAYTKLALLTSLGLAERLEVPQRSGLPAYALEQTLTVPTLTGAQDEAVEAISTALAAGRYGGYLLQGVTGSGKTEVYLRVIERALAVGKTALVLVPEIALTPQLGARFRARFGDRVATFHSGLTPAQRRDEWERVQSGRAPVGLGARSALFLPLRNLGVVIVDEEHESSFKQDESPRYHARDLAVARAHRANAVVVLGSATPSLETRHNALRGRYERLELRDRVANRPMPEVSHIDMSGAVLADDGALSVRLAEALEHTLRAGEQAILLLNRRGFAPYVYCRDCGHAYRCPDCEVALTLHQRRGILLCHYCGHEVEAPERCPGCHGHRLAGSGLGTEKLEREIEALFGAARIARLDRDTVRRRADLEAILARFARGEARVLLGTQMVAKGHDFPGVTLVGVVAADATLNLPDFRAAERTFQLLTQVSGRAGRGDRLGSVLVQAYETRHYALQTAKAHDYEAFATEELRVRRELRYPPFAHLALIRCEAMTEEEARAAAEQSADSARRIAAQVAQGMEVLGPAPAPLGRLKGWWRYQVLLKASRRSDLRAVLLRQINARSQRVRVVTDIDPLNML